MLQNDTILQTPTQQTRTTQKKRLFISIFKRTLGSIKASCEKTGIEKMTYYRWMAKDPKFALAIKQAEQEKLDDVEQLANNLILAGDGAMIRHFQDRRDPRYMPRIKVDGPKPGEKSLEEIFDEAVWEDDNQKKHGSDTTQADAPVGDTATPENPQQAASDCAVHTQQGATPLLGTEDKAQPDTKGQAKGNQ